MEELKGDGRLVRGDIAWSAIDTRWIRIGAEIESSEVVVRPGSGSVFVVDATENRISPEEPHTSVYHYVIFQAALLDER